MKMDKIKKFFANRARDILGIFSSSNPEITLLSYKELKEEEWLYVATENKVNNIKTSFIPTQFQSSVAPIKSELVSTTAPKICNQYEIIQERKENSYNNQHNDGVHWANLMSMGKNNKRIAYDSPEHEYIEYAMSMRQRGLTFRNLEDMSILSNSAAYKRYSSLGKKMFPIIVRSNDIVVKCLALGSRLDNESQPTFSKNLALRLGLDFKSEIIVSSWDNRQNFSFKHSEIRTDNTTDMWIADPLAAFYYNWLARVYWSHLFGPGDLQENEDVVMVATSKAMANALESTALTVMKAPCTRRWELYHWTPDDEPLLPEDRRTPEAASYWLLDEQNYHLATINMKMKTEIIGVLNKEIDERNRRTLQTSWTSSYWSHPF